MNEFYVVARTPSRMLRRKRTNSLYASRKIARKLERIYEVQWSRPRGQG